MFSFRVALTKLLTIKVSKIGLFRSLQGENRLVYSSLLSHNNLPSPGARIRPKFRRVCVWHVTNCTYTELSLTVCKDSVQLLCVSTVKWSLLPYVFSCWKSNSLQFTVLSLLLYERSPEVFSKFICVLKLLGKLRSFSPGFTHLVLISHLFKYHFPLILYTLPLVQATRQILCN